LQGDVERSIVLAMEVGRVEDHGQVS
jgi:hypothetical protein